MKKFQISAAMCMLTLAFALVSCGKKEAAKSLPTIVLTDTEEWTDGVDLQSNRILLQFESGNEQAIFTYINKVLVIDGYRFVLDGRVGKVIVYRQSGEFVRTFGALGAGPGELTNMTDLLFDGQHLLLMGSHKMVIYTKDGEWIRDETLPPFPHTYPLENHWIQYGDHIPNVVSQHYNLLTFAKSDTSLVDSASLRRATLELIRMPNGGYFSPFDHHVYVLPSHDTLIYAVDAVGEIAPAYRIQYPADHWEGMDKFITEFEDMGQMMENPLGPSYLLAVRSLQVNSKYIFFTWMGPKGLYLVRFDKANELTHMYPLFKLFKNEQVRVNALVGAEGDMGLFTLEGITPEFMEEEFGVQIGDDFNPFILGLKFP
jgi:hypothetical protein